MQVGNFWVITNDTIKGPWQVGSIHEGASGSWYIVNKDTGRSKKIGPATGRGTNYFDRAKEEAIRRNLALGFKQDDGKRDDIYWILHELSDYNYCELAAVCLHDRGINSEDLFKARSDKDLLIPEPFLHNTANALSQIERKVTNDTAVEHMRKWLRRHHFICTP